MPIYVSYGILFVNMINYLVLVMDKPSAFCVLGKNLYIILSAFLLQSFKCHLHAPRCPRFFISSDMM